MRIKFLLIAGVYMCFTTCQNHNKEAQKTVEGAKTRDLFDLPDSLSARRISFVLKLKKIVAENAWPAFGEKSTEGTLIYFNGAKSEVFFPSPLVIATLEDYNKYSDDYLLTDRTDSVPYHMENMLSFDSADSSRFYYEDPVEQYSSVEEIVDFIPVESTEMWATMVIHEMFHHYQLNNEHYKDYAKSAISTLAFNPNNFATICKEDNEFLPMIHKENDYLMQAISEQIAIKRNLLILNYLKARESRIKKYSTEYPDLELVENFYVIQEGSARYIEYKSMLILSEFVNTSNPTMILEDPMFKSFAEFKEVDLSKPAFNYLIYPAPSDYHYVIGLNIMRLLDELEIEYKPYLLNKPQKALHQYLTDYIKTLPNNT